MVDQAGPSGSTLRQLGRRPRSCLRATGAAQDCRGILCRRDLQGRRRAVADIAGHGERTHRAPARLAHRSWHRRPLLRQPPARRAGTHLAARPRADQRPRRSRGRRYDPAVRDRPPASLQAVLLCRAAAPVAGHAVRSPAARSVCDRNRPRALADAGELRRALPERRSPRNNLGNARHAYRRADRARTRHPRRFGGGARAYAGAAVDDA
ncbi:hypothetical protein ACVWW1_008094 [Bradyrhizobium sp. JR3.5]